MKPEAPGDWAVERLGSVAEVILSNVDKKSSPDEQPVRLCNYMDVYANVRITTDLPFMEATATPAQIERFGLRVGDVVITKDSEDPSDIAVPSVVVDEFDGSVVCGYHLAILRPRRVDGPYLSWALRSRPVNAQFTRRANGSTRFGLTNEVIRSAWIPFPPVPEQRKIAAILSTVDDAIAATRKVIEQTKRVKQGLLQTLITRGIGHTRFKRTEVGAVPEAWEVRRLLEICHIASGQVDPREAPYADLPLIAPNHIESASGRLLLIETASDQAAISGKYQVQIGDVVYSKIRPYLRKAWLSDRRCLCSADMYPITAGPDVVPRFLLAIMLSDRFSDYASAVSMRTGIPKINRAELSEYSIALPPREEQETIAAVLDGFDKKLERDEAVQSSLGLLKRGLMQDLLTGRVRVQPD